MYRKVFFLFLLFSKCYNNYNNKHRIKKRELYVTNKTSMTYCCCESNNIKDCEAFLVTVEKCQHEILTTKTTLPLFKDTILYMTNVYENSVR